MQTQKERKWIWILCGIGAAVVFLRFAFGLISPFLLGLGIALCAEPLVRAAQNRLGLGRTAAAVTGVAAALVILAACLALLGTVLVRYLERLGEDLPELERTAGQGIGYLRCYLCDLACRAPGNLGMALQSAVSRVFDDGNILIEQALRAVPGMVTDFLGQIPDGALRIGTGLLASFLISARLPKMRAYLARRLPPGLRRSLLPALRRARKAMGGWLRAQAILAAVTYAIVGTGLTVLKIPYGLLWALLIALLDAVPMLGTGLVLIPWAVLCLLRRQILPAIGMLLIVGTCAITRSTLEPRLLGKHLGLDALVTLTCLYLGYRLWGFWGLVLAPVAAAAVAAAVREDETAL